LYDAQIELVDNEVNWWYCKYPDSFIRFLKNHTLDQLHTMWSAWYEKVKNVYNVRFTSNTMSKILYDFWRKHLSFEYDYTFEDLIQIPWLAEVQNYRDEYSKRIEKCYQMNNIGFVNKNLYVIWNTIWRWMEYVYLIIRKLLKSYLKKDIEKF
jgi:hypothetical protein